MNVVAYGGGLNSTAMIIGMHRKNIPVDLVLFADTGGEHPHTYDFIAAFNRWLEAHGMPQIIMVRYHTRDGKRLTLEEECLRSATLPSIAYGHKKCSLKHKIGPQDKYCNNDPRCRAIWKAGEKVNKFVGYDAGEQRWVSHARERIDPKYSCHYPLFDWGWTREDCLCAVEAEGLTSPGKSSCFFCPSMKKAEIQWLYTDYPDLYDRAIAMEENAAPTLKTVKGLGRSWSWSEYIDIWLQLREFEGSQMKLAGFEESPGCLCDMPCGCYDG